MRYLFPLALIVTPVLAQTGFDVVSIKPSDPFSEWQRIGISDSGSFEAIGVRLSDLIQRANNLPPRSRAASSSRTGGYGGYDRSVTLHGFAEPARVETRFEQRAGGSRCCRQRGEPSAN